MEHRPTPVRPTTPRKAPTLCRIEILQSALNGLVPLDHRLESMLDHVEART
ncbi:hypothetical protein [uncultured Roseobacter sp.]|uniref:hypothetical protein n=1 Tax=uncultured Roseobacter sp. TaxID=114847 RepID=UPI0026241765|nr:hypothetical protein [uncultured Roseobacter sp.]